VLVLGLGNPILGDDGVGWHAAEAVSRNMAAGRRTTGSRVEVDCAALGGLRLMERMLGYDRVILIDSIETHEGSEGRLQVLSLEELPDPCAGHTASAHDASLRTALEMARALGAAVPSRVDVVAVEVRNVYRFSERLSEPVLQRMPRLVEAVFDLLAKEET
jgi:hydrogenase maturation protease